ncbi:ribonuclease III [Suilimivivens aceti]|uniref:Mini-ribonuclease 3 n=1 Tax=Suilimivivens aceti TaxID=2981774 RepID=A0ABT2T576_9FIRM|nr:ribonuclease III domain-containing protein [Suilimivivens aceti]MCU6745402.1 ribonuclease III [Suilimivivens aceti]SCI18311.1 Mini-ribonuclease 3 [uncultured Clostridium sp.]
MEESLSLSSRIRELFGLKEVDMKAYSPLTLAYIGDAAYELVIRTMVVEKGNRQASQLHRLTTSYVKAQAQAAMIEALEPELTEEELAIYKRGRNAKSYTSAKNASILDYRKATGLETLIGYLYLSGREERVLFLIKEGISRI